MYDLDDDDGDDGDEIIGAAFTTDRTIQEIVMIERAKSILQWGKDKEWKSVYL